MIPQGIGWQHLRSVSLDAIPTGTSVYHTTAVPFHEWRKRGAFTVGFCSKKSVILESAGEEIGVALLSDGEFFADHAAEHAAHVHDVIKSRHWSSPAWNVVTVYYWAFFSVMAITRLVGRSTVFLDRDALSDFATLAGATEQPGAGAIYLDIGPYSTATLRSISLRPAKLQLHDAVWRSAHRLISEVASKSDPLTNSVEHHFWSVLKRSADRFGPDWPSKLRNAINYRPGCGYLEVTRKATIDLAASMKSETPVAMQSLADLLEKADSDIAPGSTPWEDTRVFSRLLGFYAVAMTAVLDLLHSEVVERQGADRRWRRLRKRFFLERFSASDCTWPFSGS